MAAGLKNRAGGIEMTVVGRGDAGKVNARVEHRRNRVGTGEALDSGPQLAGRLQVLLPLAVPVREATAVSGTSTSPKIRS